MEYPEFVYYYGETPGKSLAMGIILFILITLYHISSFIGTLKLYDLKDKNKYIHEIINKIVCNLLPVVINYILPNLALTIISAVYTIFIGFYIFSYFLNSYEDKYYTINWISEILNSSYWVITMLNVFYTYI